MTDRMVKFAEHASGGKRAQKNADTYLIDPSHVSIVAPRKDYTTLLVQGKWIHVAHSAQEVMSKLGWEESD